MKKIMFVILFAISMNLIANSDSTKLDKTIKEIKKAIIEADSKLLIKYFEFPIRNENLVQSYNWNFEKNEKELNLTQFTNFLKKTFVNTRLGKPLKKYNNSLIKDQPNCSLLYKPNFCNVMCCWELKGDTIKISFYQDDTASLLDIDSGKSDDEDICEEFAEFYGFQIIKNKIKFVYYDVAG